VSEAAPETIPVRLDAPEASLPTRAHPDDAGLDLRAAEALEIPAGGRAGVGCGFAMALRPGTAGLVVPRSGLALRHGITVLNAPGLIDAGYRGEVRVILQNHGAEPFRVAVGDRIAQLVVIDLAVAEVGEAAELPDGDRGEAGFGSTGLAG
jgi:dUTP pyrophosphatase